MALSPRTVNYFEPASPHDQAPEHCGRNDSFSFWKLPEEWRPALEGSIRPSGIVADLLLREDYLPDPGRRTLSAMRAYYHVKRLIPRPLRHCLNSAAIAVRTPPEFPRWPCESALIELRRDWLKNALETLGLQVGWHIGFWPHGFRTCIVLTHDIETRKGFDRMEAVADLEERWGFRSA